MRKFEIGTGKEAGLEIRFIIDYTDIQRLLKVIEDNPEILSPHYGEGKETHKQFTILARRPQKNSDLFKVYALDWKVK